MRRLGQGFGVLAVAFSGLLMTTQAGAIEPLPQSTFVVAAERLASSNFVFNGGTSWNNQFFGAPANTPFGSPRLGLDYFIIDGLSIGGHVGLGLYVPNQGESAGWLAFMPRVGYAFALTRSIDFWPRVGFGLIAAGNSFGTTTGVISMEGMFLANLNKTVAIEFGPALDVPLADAWQDAELGANAGLAINF
jgi:hypothetical protein